MSNKQQIVIVGAGVLGLSTALVICENLTIPHELTIIGEYGPHDPSMNAGLSNYARYTSPWAGAHFRPFPSKNSQEYAEMKLTRLTLSKFKSLSYGCPESSIKFVEGVEYLENPDEFYKTAGKGYSEEIDNFTRLEDVKEGYIGFKYDTWVLNAPMYLQFLYRKLLIEYDVKFINQKLESLKQVNEYIPNQPIIINCTGMGLQYNGGYDPECFPIRGQTLLINPPKDCPYLDKTITYQHADGNWTFVIPRPLNGGVILGGTKQPNEWSTEIRRDDTEALKKRGEAYFPELMKVDEDGKRYFDVLKINVGLRPARKSGLRIETEKRGGNYIIHNYGAGGMGYELSYGSGLKVYENLLAIIGRQYKL
ncbi:uncharacterized protein J8A68_000446 [[Candida] subhashii]|uniref:FAD dependent oxidoreductase domain-containing protein n=1 Tax=[Candida] subhashii TaxID=561895 RepID=A0A8J5US33_9ASCO|nr:uncharacterized protein J8A68_000446 [[Candida] subhashii]KAG7666016.1 hypothetical protein J8A68_000446 [[Candida] subhashii]